MTFEVAGKHVLVTGASAGIGAAMARGLAERGAVVGICARRADRLDEVLADCRTASPDSRAWTIDLSDLAALPGFVDQVIGELGGLDVLVNNAGMPKRRRVAATTPGDVDLVMALNYLSPVHLVLAALPRMLERARRDRTTAHIVNVGSVAARLSPPGEAAYAASKAAITAFSESLAVELWNEPIDVHVVHPGVIDTELFDLPDNDPLLAEEVERLPASAVFDTVLAQLDAGRFETWVPEWFADVAKVKADDVQGYLEGAAMYWQEKQQKT